MPPMPSRVRRQIPSRSCDPRLFERPTLNCHDYRALSWLTWPSTYRDDEPIVPIPVLRPGGDAGLQLV
jgi:hypothetical protein